MKSRKLFYHFAILTVVLLAFSNCKKEEKEEEIINTDVPVLTTSSVTFVCIDSAKSGGYITSDGGAEVTARGVCWSTSQNPTIADSKTTDGAGIGVFASKIMGLVGNTTYYVRAYATNSKGTGYGAQITFISSNTQKEMFKQMINWMTGSFSSHNQADTTTDQYIVDVRLHMAQIWNDRNVGENIYWLYVEQAYASDTAHPYRQRIYKMILGANNNIYNEIFSVPNPTNYIYGYKTPSIFNSLTENDLTVKTGCGLNFTWNQSGQYYIGATSGHNCLVTGIPNVNYITSDATLHQTYMTSWDRGYHQSGILIMGPDSPYIFDKIEAYPFVYKSYRK